MKLSLQNMFVKSISFKFVKESSFSIFTQEFRVLKLSKNPVSCRSASNFVFNLGLGFELSICLDFILETEFLFVLSKFFLDVKGGLIVGEKCY